MGQRRDIDQVGRLYDEQRECIAIPLRISRKGQVAAVVADIQQFDLNRWWLLPASHRARFGTLLGRCQVVTDNWTWRC